jgi:hypothetical protein
MVPLEVRVSTRNLVFAFAGCALAASCGLHFIESARKPVSAAGTDVPVYASNGDLLPLTNYRAWI